MTTDCLVLTPWMHPHQTASWQEAVTKMYLKQADVLESYDAYVSSPSMKFQLPAVVRLKALKVTMKADVKFSRINVYTRDGFRCQYCGKKCPMKGLNYDHVIPRSKGGPTTWTNIVTSCIACNLKKDCKTIEQIGFKLLKKPVKPKSLPVSGVFLLPRVVPELWRPYLLTGSLEETG